MCIAGENPGDYYSVLIVVTGLALLIKYVQITTVYSLFHTNKNKIIIKKTLLASLLVAEQLLQHNNLRHQSFA